MKIIFIIFPFVLLTGCASVVGSKLQPVTVQTISDGKPVVGAGCTLINDAGKWFITSPGSTTVQKSTGDLSVNCLKDGAAGQETIVSKSNGAVWANILVGGGIGYVVDRSTGAGFDYPGNITVTLIGGTKPTDAPVGSNQVTVPVATGTSPEAVAKSEPSKADGRTQNKPDNMNDKLRELQKMRDDGLITDQEYLKKKQDYLSRL